MSARVLIVGFGNALAGDDGCGSAVVERLRALPLPPQVRVEEGHSDSLRLHGLWRGEQEVWLVDALARGAPPGTVHYLGHDELLDLPQTHRDAHGLSLPENLRWLRLACPELRGVRFRLWGIEPLRLEPSQGLSEPVARGVRLLAEELEREVARALALEPGPLG